MAQLIKLRDYVSRYEWNTYRYPTQFIRMKHEQWQQLYNTWEEVIHQQQVQKDEKKQSIFLKWKNLFRKNTEKEENNPIQLEREMPQDEQALRKYFLKKMYPFQLKWATSTVTEVSYYDPSYEEDAQLIYFLTRLPDIYLILYKPIFTIKNAPIDGEIILISPVGIEILYVIEAEEGATIIADHDRIWYEEKNHKRSSFLNPLISLKRNEHIIKTLLQSHGIHLQIRKTIFSKHHVILAPTKPYQTNVVDKRTEEKWLLEKRRLNTTLKRDQLKSAEILLNHCLTNAVKRPEWEEAWDE